MRLNIVLDDEKCMPYKEHTQDIGYDLRSNNENTVVLPGEKTLFKTGVKAQIPKGHVGIIAPRSGLGTKYELSLANTIGIIDPDYRGELLVWVVNRGKEDIFIKKYDRFCQLLILPALIANLNIVGELGSTSRGVGGFGHTGVE